MNIMNLDGLLRKLHDVRIAVLGDFCLDVYWTMDEMASEISVETGLPVRKVRGQRCSLGGAGNVVSNLVALGVGRVSAMGIIGDDPFGHEMRRRLLAQNVECAGVLTQSGQWDTPVYIKPLLAGREESRLDLGNYNQLREDTANALIVHLRNRLDELDAVIINQQLLTGVHTPYFQGLLQDLFKAYPHRLFVVDTRHLSGVYTGCILKVNDFEATTLCGGIHQPLDSIVFDEARNAAVKLYQRSKKPVFVTRGARGCLVVDESGLHATPGLHIINKVDPVGAGDSMTAGLTAALASGASPEQAMIFGNFVAGVTVQKLFQTGTAAPTEVLAIGRDPDYVYAPELADDPRQARYIEGSEIESVEALAPSLRITHAIFDHDGTISTLRQGWEAVMEPMMIRTILGEHYATADETLYNRVVGRVREFIDKTTGIQTLVQMQGLAELTREFGFVPAGKILDGARYKAIYLDALMERVLVRIDKLKRQELDVADFTIKKAPEFLQRLHAAGVRLYLASGTDEADVIAEAEALGYARYFEGRIYGATGDASVEAKRMVLDRILKDIGSDHGAQIAAFGDGPVEIRETRKRGGVAIGIASDEIRRYGLNPEKRSRLIRAGAHLIIPDYSRMEPLLQRLGIGNGCHG